MMHGIDIEIDSDIEIASTISFNFLFLFRSVREQAEDSCQSHVIIIYLVFPMWLSWIYCTYIHPHPQAI